MNYLTKHQQRDAVRDFLNEQDGWIEKRKIVMWFINKIVPNITQSQKDALANLVEIGWAFYTLRKSGVIESNGKRGSHSRWRIVR